MKRVLSFIILAALILSIIPTTLASNTTFEYRDDAIFKGFSGGVAQYVEIGEDMNGTVDSDGNSSDDNPVPTNAKYTNGFYVQGAQLRTETSGMLFWQTVNITGMRFVIVSSVDMISKMQNAGLSNISYGALVEIDHGFNLTNKNAFEVEAVNIYKSSTDLNSDYQKYTVCITNIDSLNLRTNVAVRPYLTYTDLSGDEHTIYGEQYSCNIYAVGSDAYHNGNEGYFTKKAIEDNILKHYPNGSGGYMYSNEFQLTDTAILKKWRTTTNQRINEIKNTPNIQIPEGATVYYISNNGNNANSGTSPNEAWQTSAKLKEVELKPGDYVLFERGGYFRGSFSTKSGVTYSAYGKGEKPIICASPEDGADPKKWKNVGGNIWVYDTKFYKDIGTMVFNHGEAHAVKWLVYKNKEGVLQEFRTKVLWDGPETMTNDLDMWHNNAGYSGTDYKVYLYSEQNPGERFESIEFLQRENAVGCGGDNVTIDNLSIKYTGAHGIGGGTKKNLTVQNCEFHWIGGALHFVAANYNNTGADRPTRYGNAVEIYGGCDGFTIQNCYFNQIYDAAVTPQFNFNDAPGSLQDNGHYNVLFKDNVMEYCTYSIEFFLGNLPSGNTSHIDNVVFDGNLMWYAGEGLGAQRPDPTQPAHIKGWGHQNPVKNFVIKNNLLAYSTSMLIHANFNNLNANGEIGVKLENNVLIGNNGQKFGMFGYNTKDVTTDYVYGVQGYLKDFTNGDKFYFIEE